MQIQSADWDRILLPLTHMMSDQHRCGTLTADKPLQMSQAAGRGD